MVALNNHIQCAGEGGGGGGEWGTPLHMVALNNHIQCAGEGWRGEGGGSEQE